MHACGTDVVWNFEPIMSRAIDSETASVFSSEALDLDPRSSDSTRRCLAKVLTLFIVAVVWSVAFVFPRCLLVLQSGCLQ